jgi:alkanesulfonate monooxygenase SsuD/methylene tetrahydromethanopterin reductase-like flavin-dependent oxidoreductase (luciferase family)
MRYGIVLPTPADAWKTVQRAEALGFESAWFFDTQLVSADIFVAMGAAAVSTNHIRLGTGVLIPSNRIAPVAANALASLNALAPGRIDFGIGTGFTGRLTMGLPAVKLAEMKEYIRIVYGLLEGKTLTWSFEDRTRKIRFLNAGHGLINIRDPIPLWLSAFGPKSRALTAELGAGWINIYRDLTDAARALERMREAWTAADTPAEKRRNAILAYGCPLAPGEPADSDRAMALAGPMAAVTLHRSIEGRGMPIDHLPDEMRRNIAAFGQLYESYRPADARYLSLHEGHLLYVREDERRYVTADLIKTRTLTGSEAELRERVYELERMGYQELAVQVLPGLDYDQQLGDWARVLGLG